MPSGWEEGGWLATLLLGADRVLALCTGALIYQVGVIGPCFQFTVRSPCSVYSKVSESGSRIMGSRVGWTQSCHFLAVFSFLFIPMGLRFVCLFKSLRWK